MKRIFTAIVFFLILLSLSMGQTIHAIIACDDNDPVLGKAASQDFLRISDFSRFLSEATGYRLELTALQGKNFTKEKVGAAVRNTYPGSDDIVLFYYSGIGFRMAGKKSWSPYLLFPGEQKVDGEAVFRDLTGRTGGTLIMLIEAGNIEYDADTVHLLSKAVPSKSAMENAKKLVLGKKYYIFQTAASPGEPSFAFPEGSAMTTIFVETFMKALENPGSTWESILADTQSKITADTVSQQSSRFFSVDHTPSISLSGTSSNDPTKSEIQAPQPNIKPPKPEIVQTPQTPPPPVNQKIFGEPSSAFAGSIISNEKFSPKVFSFSGGTLFEGTQSAWFLVFDAEPKPIVLKRVALESYRIVFRSPNDSIVIVEPLDKKAQLSIKKTGKTEFENLFPGEWKNMIARYTF